MFSSEILKLFHSFLRAVVALSGGHFLLRRSVHYSELIKRCLLIKGFVSMV